MAQVSGNGGQCIHYKQWEDLVEKGKMIRLILKAGVNKRGMFVCKGNNDLRCAVSEADALLLDSFLRAFAMGGRIVVLVRFNSFNDWTRSGVVGFEFLICPCLSFPMWEERKKSRCWTDE